MAADASATQVAKVSAVMVLSYFSPNCPVLAPEGLICLLSMCPQVRVCVHSYAHARETDTQRPWIPNRYIMIHTCDMTYIHMVPLAVHRTQAYHRLNQMALTRMISMQELSHKNNKCLLVSGKFTLVGGQALVTCVNWRVILDLARLPQATVTRMPRLESWEITEK